MTEREAFERAKKHLQQMAPHVRGRESAKIIADLIKDLESANARMMRLVEAVSKLTPATVVGPEASPVIGSEDYSRIKTIAAELEAEQGGD